MARTRLIAKIGLTLIFMRSPYNKGRVANVPTSLKEVDNLIAKGYTLEDDYGFKESWSRIRNYFLNK